jgi:hypothetical protein
VSPILASELLSLPVRLHGIQLGRPADLLLDRSELRVVGFDVHCGDDIHRFLPLLTALVKADEICIRSPLVMLEEDELAFYRARSFGLSALRGRAVERSGQPAGTLVDVVVASDGSVTELVVDRAGSQRRIANDATVRVAPKSRSAA